MELSAFAAPSFSATQWLNSLLDPLDPSESAIESTANEVSFKLQLFIHQLSLSLQDTAFQVTHTGPIKFILSLGLYSITYNTSIGADTKTNGMGKNTTE